MIESSGLADRGSVLDDFLGGGEGTEAFFVAVAIISHLPRRE
jgi:hypothetical protein